MTKSRQDFTSQQLPPFGAKNPAPVVVEKLPMVTAQARPDLISTQAFPSLTDAKEKGPFSLEAGQDFGAQKNDPFFEGYPPDIQTGLGASEPKQNACGGSFATSPSCSDDPKNKSLIQKIICQGMANPVDSITFALLTAATVPAVVLQTAKWVNCGKPSKGALYVGLALGAWGVEVVRSINNIYVDEKNL